MRFRVQDESLQVNPPSNDLSPETLKTIKVTVIQQTFGRLQDLQIHREFSIDYLPNISRTFKSILKRCLLQAHFGK